VGKGPVTNSSVAAEECMPVKRRQKDLYTIMAQICVFTVVNYIILNTAK
jgi:hypothetical protein